MNNPLEQRWFILKDDIVGGWAIANVDKHLVSALDWKQGDTTVGEFISLEVAQHIASRHNLELDLKELNDGRNASDLPWVAWVRKDDQS